jgi:hypothetical protein
VHYAINLANLQCDHFQLTDEKTGETFRRFPVSPGDLMLGDRAYGTPAGVSHVGAAGGAVLVRIALHMMPLYTQAGLRLPVLSRAGGLRIGQVGEWRAWVHHESQPIAGRLVAIKRSRQAAQHAQQRLQCQARRKQLTLSDQALRAAGYVLLWTSVPAGILSAREILEWYRLRWQIELAFKRMKSIMGLGHLPKWSDASCRAWIHGELFVALLIEQLLDAAEAVSPWGYQLAAAPQPMA